MHIVKRWNKLVKELAPDRGCRLQCNTLTQAPGLTNYRKNFKISLEAFQLLFTNKISQIIMTIRKQSYSLQLNHTEWKLPNELVNTFVGMLIGFGATRGRKESTMSIWSEDTKFSRPIFKATMSLDVFKNMLPFIRTDDYQTRLQQKSTDKLAGIKEVWKIFIANCQKCLVLQPQMSVDKQLVGSRGRCPFRVYKSKRDRCGIKI